MNTRDAFESLGNGELDASTTDAAHTRDTSRPKQGTTEEATPPVTTPKNAPDTLGLVKVLMTGLYGWASATDFIAMLRRVKPSVVIDTRYSTRAADNWAWIAGPAMQMMMQLCGIAYVHLQSAAPTEAMVQRLVRERSARVGNQRGPRFGQPLAAWYADEYMDRLTPEVVAELGRLIGNGPALILGVDSNPGVCHRSILAERLSCEGYVVEQVRSEAEPVSMTAVQRLGIIQRQTKNEREATVSLLHSLVDITRREAVGDIIELKHLPLGRVNEAIRVLEARMASA